MCLSCGKGRPNDNHGDPSNITAFDIDAAAQAGGLHPIDVARNIYNGVREEEQSMSLLERIAQR